jgi:hypothetical protein
VFIIFIPDLTGLPSFSKWICKADARKSMIAPQKIRNWSAEDFLKAFRNIPSGSKVTYEKV